MNIEKAIACYEGFVGGGYEGTFRQDLDKFVLATLRAQAELDNPKPLTLEELWDRAGKPVYIVSLFSGHGEWYVLSTPATDDHRNIVTNDNDSRYHGDYGKTWLAYDQEPKETRK
jgi:hypothetical protein